jgi:hypothetical protein
MNKGLVLIQSEPPSARELVDLLGFLPSQE